jgi:hypothetical protein
MKNDLTKLAQKIEQLSEDLQSAKAEYDEIRLTELRKVSMKKNDSSITLLFNGRTINAKKNRWGRFAVKEGKTTLVKEYFGNIHDLRFDIAQGAV